MQASLTGFLSTDDDIVRGKCLRSRGDIDGMGFGDEKCVKVRALKCRRSEKGTRIAWVEDQAEDERVW